MKSAAKILSLVFWFGVVATGASGTGQEAKIAAGQDEIRRFETLVEQPTAQNNGIDWWHLAILYQDNARYADAERAYWKAQKLLLSSDERAQANLMDQMGTMYVEMGRYAEAQDLERKALAIRVALKDSLGVGLSWMHLAMLSLGEHRNTDGEMYAELAVERLASDHGGRKEQDAATPEQKMTALVYLSLARCAANGCVDAVPPLKRAMVIAEGNYPTESFPVAYVHFLEGYARWKQGDRRSAAMLMKRGTAGMEAQLGWGHPTYISAMRQYAVFLVESGHESEAASVKQKLARLSGAQPVTQSAQAERISTLP
jgi:tetratricopeptide (TPR) repeat protein